MIVKLEALLLCLVGSCCNELESDNAIVKNFVQGKFTKIQELKDDQNEVANFSSVVIKYPP
jgi:hypothetical protein